MNRYLLLSLFAVTACAVESAPDPSAHDRSAQRSTTQELSTEDFVDLVPAELGGPRPAGCSIFRGCRPCDDGDTMQTVVVNVCDDGIHIISEGPCMTDCL